MAFKIIIPFVIIIFMTGCPLSEDVIEPYDSYYLIKNNSSQDLYFYRKSGIKTNYIAKDSIGIAFCFATWAEDAYFHIGSDTLYVYAADSVTLLKTWAGSYDITSIGKQFYRENDWSFHKYQEPNGDKIILEWIFEITDADLQ